MGKPEAKIEKYLTTRVEATGGEIRKARWIGRTGCPDRFAWWDGGVYAWVEAKAEGEDVDWTSLQGREIRRMHDAGLTVYVVNSREAVDRMIEVLVGG